MQIYIVHISRLCNLVTEFFSTSNIMVVMNSILSNGNAQK